MNDIEELENQQRVDMFNRELPYVADTLSAPQEWPGPVRDLEENTVLPNGRVVPWYQKQVDMQNRKWGKAAGKYAKEQANPPSNSSKRLERVVQLQTDDLAEE